MSEDSRIKNYVYPAICVVCLMGAGYLLYRSVFSPPIREMPDTKDSATAWKCAECGYSEMLTPRQRAERQMEGNFKVTRASGDQGQQTSMRTLHLLCPSCGAFAMHTATQCPDCGTIYLGGVCPVCHPDQIDPDGPEAQIAENHATRS